MPAPERTHWGDNHATYRRLKMSKVLFVLDIQEPKVRKKQAPPNKRHKDVTKYSRKQKHKAKREEAPGNSGAFFIWGGFQRFCLP